MIYWKKWNQVFYREVDIQPSNKSATSIQKKYNELEGKSPDQQSMQYQILEMHVEFKFRKVWKKI